MTEGVREFPCTQCGAKVEFAPGTEALICPYCGDETHIPASDEGLDEQDLKATLMALERDAETEESSSVQCPACAALVEPEAAQEAFPCPYCGTGIVATGTGMVAGAGGGVRRTRMRQQRRLIRQHLT